VKWKVAAVLAVALVASGCRVGGTSAKPTAATESTGPLPVAATSRATGGGVQLETALAAAGVATVADENATSPAVPVTGAQVLTVTTWQVANLNAEAAAHGGITGADLDTMLPMPATAPALADIIGGWVIAGGDPTATAAGALLDNPDWTHPEQVVFPTAALTLFEADLLQHVAAGAPASQPASPAASQPASPAASQPASPAASQPANPTASEPASPVASGASSAAWHGNAPVIEDVSLVTAPCSTVSNFVDAVLDKVFSLLKVNPADVSNFVNGVVGGGVLGAIAGGVAGFLTGFWNHAVDLAEQAVKGVLKALTQPVLNVMALVIGGVAVISMIRSYLQQWTAGVVAEPAGTTFPITPNTTAGNVTVSIDTNAEIQDWPKQMVDCAAAADVTLPTLAKAGSPVTWTASPQEPGLITPGTLTGTLDAKLTQTLTYVTGNEDAKTHTTGTLVSPTVTTTVQVRRTEVEELRNFVTAYITGKVPAIVAPVLNPILAAYIELATEYLDKITAVTGTTTFVVSHHVPKTPSPSPTPTSSCNVSGTTIPAGSYAGPIKATLTTQMHLNLPQATIPDAGGGTEALTGNVTVVSNGKQVSGTITLSGLGLSQVGLPGSVNVHTVDNGGLTATISGSASSPMVNGTLTGEWASLDAPVINATGSADSPIRAGLHITRAGCDSISGDAIAMFAEFASSVAQYLSFGGSGTWTATRTSAG
jgi:hypothetical protein